MATVDIFQASRMKQIEDTTIVGGLVDVNGNLLLEPRVGDPIDAGYVRGPAGIITDATAIGLPTGEAPTVTLGGTPTDRTIEFGLPTGPQGIQGDSSLPAGTINLWSGDVAPTGWLLCDGAAVSRTTYASLYNAIGIKYGAGNGSTTFNVPNLKGRVPVGKDSAQTEFDNIGETGGAKTASQTQSHSHVLGAAGQALVAIAARAADQILMRRITTANFTPTHSIDLSGGGAGGYATTEGAGAQLAGATDSESVTTIVSTLPPYHVVNFIIKTTSGESPGDSELSTRVGEIELQVGDNELQIRDRMAKAQRVLTGGGIRKVTSTSVSWGSRFMSIGAGWQDPALSGYWQINMPPDGTVIPVYGTTGVTSQTVAGGLISLSPWYALYYDIPLNANKDSDPSRFKLVGYTEKLNFTPPPTWVLIAVRNGDALNPVITWGDGQQQDYWRTFTLGQSWVDFGGGYVGHQWKHGSDGSIKLRGLIKSGTFSSSVAVASWSTDMAPEEQEIFICASSTGHVRVDIKTNGELLMYAAYNTGSNAWVSLAGVSWFPVGV